MVQANVSFGKNEKLGLKFTGKQKQKPRSTGKGTQSHRQSYPGYESYYESKSFVFNLFKFNSVGTDLVTGKIKHSSYFYTLFIHLFIIHSFVQLIRRVTEQLPGGVSKDWEADLAGAMNQGLAAEKQAAAVQKALWVWSRGQVSLQRKD